MGCFWGVERMFWQAARGLADDGRAMPAATRPNPTYQEVCSGQTGHNEVVRVIYRPGRDHPTRSC